jgi:hypothetical protein
MTQAANPAMAATGKTTSFAVSRTDDQMPILMAAPSSGGEPSAAPPMKKSHTGVTPYGLCHDCRCPVPPPCIQLPSTEMVSCRRDNFATAAPGIGMEL